MDKKKTLLKQVKLNFVIPPSCKSEEGVNDSMKIAFEECMQADLSPKWLTVADCDNISGPKNTVFVLQEFEGDIFQKLRKTKSVRVCGPMCLRSCLKEGSPIPENKSPVFTTAMRAVIVTASQLPPIVKADIKEKVGFMGGVYLNVLVESVTHLVTNGVRSSKYEIAGERGIPAMTVEWVEAVWKESQQNHIKATDPMFMALYKCPTFFNMFITCSNLSKQEKEEMKELINKNGGTWTAQMRQKETTLVVVNEARGEKYKHALSWALPCVKPSYIIESVKRGYAIPYSGHLVGPSVKCSTPTKDDGIPNFTFNSETSISMINFDISKSQINETQMTSTTFNMPGTQKRPAAIPSSSQHVQILNSISVSNAKKAGSFMDGCKIFLSGFSAAETEKLRRILSLGGATVFSELTDSVSHVLVGEFIVQDMKTVSALCQKPHVVTLEWLAACIRQQSPASEEPFLCLETRRELPEPPSPLSQKGMQLLHPPADQGESSKMPPPAEPSVSKKLFSEFLKENTKSPAKQQSGNQKALSESSSLDSTTPEIFVGLKFVIVGFFSNVTEDIEGAVQAAGGSCVPAYFTGVPDYAVVPLEAAAYHVNALQVVTHLWVEDCLAKKELLPVLYYHQPVSVDTDKKPLSGCCVSLSNYFGREKMFITELAQILGATCQDVFARVAKENKGILQSTHLVCPKADGQKYKAAVRWGLPTLTGDWLLACARSGSKADEEHYLVSQLKDSETCSETPKRTEQKPATTSTPASVVTPLTTRRPNPAVTPSTSKPSPGMAQTPLTSQSNPVTPVATFRHPVVTSLKRKSSAASEELSPFHVSTPDTPYGQFLETPDAETKKRWKRFIDDFPSKPDSTPSVQKKPRRVSTPLSELKRRIWAAALENSTDNANQNYSIQEMDDEGNENQNIPTPVENRESSPLTPVRISKPTTSCLQSSTSKEKISSKRVSVGRSTPTVSDFSTPPSQQKSSDKSPRAMKSPANEMVCAMLGQLHQRLSTRGNKTEEPQPLPQRQLVSPTEETTSMHKPVASWHLPESQPVLIGWEDPVESAERAKVQSSPTVSPGALRTESPENRRRFVLSNVAEREKYEELLKSLGEDVGIVSEYDSSTTHLIVDLPLRSEKLLCCLAAGKWILHTSYIDQMVKHKKYLPEEEKYEWGNPLSVESLPILNPGSIEQQLAHAAVRWRKQLSGGSAGAFTDMRVVLVASPNKYESYKRLILAGGGQILPTSSFLQATHCFVEASKVSSMSVKLSQFVAHRVPCLPPVYLGEMLTKFPPPPVSEGLLPEYRRLLQLQTNNE